MMMTLPPKEEEGSAEENEEDLVEWEGYVYKRGHIIRSWKRRFVTLRGTCFTYYTTKQQAQENKHHFKGQVYITAVWLDSSKCRRQEQGFVFETERGKTFYVEAETRLETHMWIGMIESALARKSIGRCCDDEKTSSAMIHSNDELKNRNTTVVTDFLQHWRLVLETDWSQQQPEYIIAKVLGLFQFCSKDIHVTIDMPLEYWTEYKGRFYGREGLFHHLTTFQRRLVALGGQFCLDNLVAVKVHVFQATARIHVGNHTPPVCWKAQMTVSPGGKLSSMAIYYDLDPTTMLSTSTVTSHAASSASLETASSFVTDCSSSSQEETIQQQHWSRTKRAVSLNVADFKVHCILGKGAFGTVVMAEAISTQKLYAIKVLDKTPMSSYDRERAKTEMKILRDVHHPFIARLDFSFQSDSKVYLGMPFFPGGSLYKHLHHKSTPAARVRFSTPQARFYAAQIVLAISHLHSCDIVYRDLKPDNIMLNADGYIVLVDFGLSKLGVHNHSGARTMAGSPGYTAPELLKPRQVRKYGRTVDWWCLGILLYEMLYAARPFAHSNVSVLYRLIEKQEVRFPPHHEFDMSVSESQCVEDLISGLLAKDPSKRLGSDGAQSIMSHPFFESMDWTGLLEKKLVPFWTPAKDERLKRCSGPASAWCLSSIDAKAPTPIAWLVSLVSPWIVSKQPQSSCPSASDPTAAAFDRFSYVADGSDSYLVDEKEILQSALHGRKSCQLQFFSTVA